MKKALFLDRDGIINEDVGYTHRIEDFKFRDGIFDICRTAQDLGYIIVIVTNQAGIGRGFYTEQDFQKLTDWMLDAFKRQNITISAVEYCPFHAEYGIGKYKIDSFRRKPNPGMILDACDALDIDPKISIMVGDKVDDMTAAERAGILTLILVTKTIYTVGVPSHTVIIEYDCLKNIQILISNLNSEV